jgi:hypothetical protein
LPKSVDVHFVDVTPSPFFSAFGRLNDGVMRGSKMGASMPVLRGIATADMPAFKAHAQMHPGVSDLETIFAALR